MRTFVTEGQKDRRTRQSWLHRTLPAPKGDGSKKAPKEITSPHRINFRYYYTAQNWIKEATVIQ